MKRPSDEGPPPVGELEAESLRERIIGLGEKSFRKTYFPALQERLNQLERFRAALDRSVDIVLLVETPSGKVVDANACAHRLLGLSREQLAQRSILELLCLESRAWAKGLLEGAQESGAFSCTLQGAEGCSVPVEMTLRHAPGQGQGYAVAVARDISERERMNKALRTSAAQLQSVVAGLPVALFALDAKGAFSLAEGRCLEAFGHPAQELLGKAVGEAIADRPELVKAAQRALLGEVVASTLSAGERVFELKCSPLKVDGPDGAGGTEGAIGVAFDVTERVQMQSGLMLADRLASVGTLAAGVAHEINNPLAYVVANVRFVQEELSALGSVLSDRPELSERLAEVGRAVLDIADGVERVRVIVRDLKVLSRADETGTTWVDLRQVLDSTASMVANEVRHRARLVKDYGPVPLVSANQARLGQVFLNLAVNAAQAMPEGKLSQNQLLLATRTDASGRAVVEVSDTGVGISKQNLPRIFDPFFTTKPVGVGTGLGLPICHSIVTALGGEIQVDSEVGRGTVFRVSLPAAVDLPRTEPAAVASVPAGPGRRLLVVDDDERIGAAVQRILSPQYQVVFLSSPRKARQRLLDGERFDLILCDLMMPELSGMELYAQLEQALPELAGRMVFFSGGAFTPAAVAFLERVGPRCLEKPFTSDALHQLLSSLPGLA